MWRAFTPDLQSEALHQVTELRWSWSSPFGPSGFATGRNRCSPEDQGGRGRWRPPRKRCAGWSADADNRLGWGAHSLGGRRSNLQTRASHFS